MEILVNKMNKLIPKIENHGDNNYSVRYYDNDDLMGIIRCKVISSTGGKKPIRQKYLMITLSDTKDLINYLSYDGDLDEMTKNINRVIYDSISKLLIKEGNQE